MKKELVVYSHSDDKKNIKYIGAGTIQRSKQFTKVNRSKSWLEVFEGKEVYVKILFRTNDYDELIKKEHYFIMKYLKNGHKLVNVLKGHHSLKESFDDDARAKMSAAKKANPTKYWLGKKRDPELMKKMLVASKKPESLKKLSDKMKERKLTIDHKVKISNSNIGRIVSEETKEKISKSKKGVTTRSGYTLSEKHKKRISRSRKNSQAVEDSYEKIWEKRKENGTDKGYTTKKAKEVYCIDLNKTFRCAKDAAKELNLSDKHIQACCVGRRKKHGGYKWSYAECT